MTKQEALDKIKELEDYIKELNNKIGFENDEIFLLSKKEYEWYKDIIPPISVKVWLRSPGSIINYAECVDCDGSFSELGDYVVCDYGVRPAIHYPKDVQYNNGDRIMLRCYPWIVIDEQEGIAIAETPITFRRFDKKNNNYKNSEIRKFLLDWWENR